MNNDRKIGIVFLHGAGLGGWIWKDVVKDLVVDYILVDYSAIYKSKQKKQA